MKQLTLHPIYIENNDFVELHRILKSYKNQKIFLLIDENTKEFCLPLLYQMVLAHRVIIIEIQSGEVNKNIETCKIIWEELLKNQANRKSLLINLGGGVLTDIGGFVAATFKRGINFVNIPTTVLGVADAAIGGKTGVDLALFKNQIGVFTKPEAVLINSVFFKTLSIRQVNSGLAEIIKCALIADKYLWNELREKHVLQIVNWDHIIQESVRVKMDIVSKDPLETGERKLLNFGHTIGHAIETYSLKNDDDALLHGEAIAIGIICESYLSVRKNKLSEDALNEIVRYLFNHYHSYNLQSEAIEELIEFMVQDKKNTDNQINFTLISKIGKGVIDQYLGLNEIREALRFYIRYINTTD